MILVLKGVSLIMNKKWQTYEEIANKLVNDFKHEFGLEKAEGKQAVSGKNTKWEIDGKGIRSRDGAIIVIECKQWTSSKPSQSHVAALAYTIKDIEGEGGLYISPLGLQEGGKAIAEAENIFEVKLNKDATLIDMTLELLRKIIVRKSCPIDSNHTMVIQYESK